MLGERTATQVLLDQKAPFHLKALAKCKKIIERFEPKEVDVFTGILLNGITGRSPHWEGERREGGLILFGLIDFRANPRIGFQLKTAVQSMIPDIGSQGKSAGIEGAIQAVIIAIPHLEQTTAESIMRLLERRVSLYRGEEVRRLREKIFELKHLYFSQYAYAPVKRTIYRPVDRIQLDRDITELRKRGVPNSDIAAMLNISDKDLEVSITRLLKSGVISRRSSKIRRGLGLVQ